MLRKVSEAQGGEEEVLPAVKMLVFPKLVNLLVSGECAWDTHTPA